MIKLFENSEIFSVTCCDKCRSVFKLGNLQNRDRKNRGEFYNRTYEGSIFRLHFGGKCNSITVYRLWRAGSVLVGLWVLNFWENNPFRAIGNKEVYLSFNFAHRRAVLSTCRRGTGRLVGFPIIWCFFSNDISGSAPCLCPAAIISVSGMRRLSHKFTIVQSHFCFRPFG